MLPFSQWSVVFLVGMSEALPSHVGEELNAVFTVEDLVGNEYAFPITLFHRKPARVA
jgi:hypothetical protein